MSLSPTTTSGPVVISRMRPVLPAEDFDGLMETAMASLPLWCEGAWSDFNAHDPGLMILEELMYGLTDLSYRAALPVEDLLRRHANGRINWQDTSLFAPTEILPTAPLSSTDFARLLYDGVPEVRYAEIAPLPKALRLFAPEVSGRLLARIVIDAAAPDPADVLSRTQRLLDAHVNLGERFEPVEAIPPLLFSMRVEIELAQAADGSHVAQALRSTIVSALCPTPRFATLEAAMTGESIDEALSGPLLERGVVGASNMPQLMTWPEAKALAAGIVSSVSGIRSVASVTIPDLPGLNDPPGGPSADAPEPIRWFLPGPAISIERPATDSGVDDLRRAIDFELPVPEAASAASAAAVTAVKWADPVFSAATGVQFTRLLPGATWQMPRTSPAPTDPIGDYYSIQNDFPPCFSLQAGELPSQASPERRASVRQLKGYLLVFEQLCANYLGQLAHTADFLSNRPQKRTAFVQGLFSVPGVLPLLDGYPLDLDETEKTRSGSFRGERGDPYLSELNGLAESESQFLARRGRVLDHLLSRFDEGFAASDDSGSFETITNKEDLLRHYAQLSHGRAQAAPMGSAQPRGRPRSGLENKFQLLLRRDTQRSPKSADKRPADVSARSPSDFYFVFESIRFLPTGPAAAAAQVWLVPEGAFQASLWHVLVNWTYQPLNGAFIAYAQALIIDDAPAHLTSQFIWLETQPDAAADAKEFFTLFHAWREAGYPALQLAIASSAATGVLPVVAGTAAAQLFGWLLGHPPAPDTNTHVVGAPATEPPAP